jgi:2-C-methyl-D-erythritol 4-phosphate cytidylyltransferase
MKRYAIIVAGGKGLRMGAEVPKQFLPIKGKPVLLHTLQAFHDFDPELQLIVVLPAEQQDIWKALCLEHGCNIVHQIASGGETRFHSVKNGLALVPDNADAVVGVHDGVRPFVSQEVLQRCYSLAEEQKAVIPVVPVVETLRKLNTGTVPRSDYRLVQTPQVFNVALLKQAYEQPYTDAFTDDASVVEAMGIQVTLTEGNRENIKITTPFDLKLAEILCK